MTRKLTHKEAVEIGMKGGKSGKGKAKARDPEKMRKAARERWRKHRARAVHREDLTGIVTEGDK